MSRETGDRAWTRLQRFVRACRRRQHDANESFARGQAVRVLAASKPGGLLLNVEAPDLSFFIADGMDITSQLVSVTNDPEVHAALKEQLSDDIRISVHAQHPVEFLGDVRDHRFDLMIFGELEPSAARLAAASLAPGGLLAVSHPAAAVGDDGAELEQNLSACGLLVSPGVGRMLIAARAPENVLARRRGGRRKRPPIRA